MDFIQEEISLIITLLIGFLTIIGGITIGIIAPLVRSKFEYLNQRVISLEDDTKRRNESFYSKINDMSQCLQEVKSDIKLLKFNAGINGKK